MKKRMTLMLIFLIIVFGGLVAWNLIRNAMIAKAIAGYEPPPVTISSVVAKQEDWQPVISAVGNLLAINGVDVNSEQAGNVTSIEFNSGEYVEKGKVLLSIDDSIDQATLKDNQASLALAEINYKRQTNLFKKGATSSSSVDTARSTLEQSQAAVQKIQTIIAQKHIKAPFSGMLGIRQVNLGQYINVGSTSIVTLQSLDPLYLQFYTPEQNLPRINEGQKIIFSIDAFPNKMFTGKITAINSKVDPSTHNVLVQASIPNCPLNAINDKNSALVKRKPDNYTGGEIIACDSQINTQNKVRKFTFTPGLFTNVKVILPQQKSVIVLPMSAITYSLFGDSVFQIKREKGADGKEVLKVYRQYVKTGEQRGTNVVVLKGLKANDEVVSSGQLKLNNGTRVKINNEIKLDPVKNVDSLGQ